MSLRLLVACGMAALLVAGLAPAPTVARDPVRFGRVPLQGRVAHLERLPSHRSNDAEIQLAVQLRNRPVAVYQGAALKTGTRLTEARKRDLRAEIQRRQRIVAPQLRALGATIQATFTDVFNGFRVTVAANRVDPILRLRGVARVLNVPSATRSNLNTVPFVNADAAWGQTGFTGKGVRIAIIDTGINYYHADFAGAGQAAWRADDGLTRGDDFPTAKVVDGWDLVGDAYDGTAGSAPQPDPDPLDCRDPNAGNIQHGTHVAGTAAGYGVLRNGTAYRGPWKGDTLSGTDFRIGPGVAPAARLMAFRVFGCSGASFVVADAIEMAVRRGADVINMSLGSPLGSPDSLDAVASDNASLAGAVVVACACNEGPSAYVASTPGSAERAIMVGAIDAVRKYPGGPNLGYRYMASFTSGGPVRVRDLVKPDVTAPGVNVFSADGSGTVGGKALSGTSMATPAVAGVAALVREARPGWLPNAIKSAIVGTADAGKVKDYDLRLSGSGVVDARAAIETRAIVTVRGATSSLAFGYEPAARRAHSAIAFTSTRSFRIVNTGRTAITYDLLNHVTAPAHGLRMVITPSSATVPAGTGRTVSATVSMTRSDGAALPATAPNHRPLIAQDRWQQPYTPITDVAGIIVARPRASGAGIYPLRVPWMVIPRGIANVTLRPATRTAWIGTGDIIGSSIRVRNRGLIRGIADLYSWGLTDGNEGMGSMDLRAGGVQSLPSSVCSEEARPTDRCLVFAINTWQKWSTASDDEFDVAVDVDHDGREDYVVVGIDAGIAFGALNGVPISLILEASTSSVVGAYYATAGLNGSTLLLAVLASQIGLKPGVRTTFGYVAASYPVADASSTAAQRDVMTTGTDPALGSQWAVYDAFRPVVNNGELQQIDPGADRSLALEIDRSRYRPRQRGQLGWMVVSLDDRDGASQADLVSVGPLP